jgi:hypothetical protein
VAAAIFLGRFELHTDDTGVEVFLILLLTGVLGFLLPKRAWLAALVGLSVPVAEVVWGQMSGVAMMALVVIGLSLAGSYTGALIRKSVSR